MIASQCMIETKLVKLSKGQKRYTGFILHRWTEKTQAETDKTCEDKNEMPIVKGFKCYQSFTQLMFLRGYLSFSYLHKYHQLLQTVT